MKETNNLKKEPSKMKELWEDFRDGSLGFTLVFAGICAVIVGIFAYLFMVFAPKADLDKHFTIVIILSIVVVFLFIVLIAMLKTTFSLVRAKLAIIIQISLIMLTIVGIVFTIVIPVKVIGTITSEAGDFSATQTCSWFAHTGSGCEKPANGGLFTVRTGVFETEVEYYCAEHFEKMKESIENSDKKDKNDIDESDVWYEAKEIVKNRLKAPSTASFCSKSSATITKSGNTWTIKGYVDAENSFGAMIRNDFTVVLVFNNDTQYTITNCTITPR